MMISYFRGNAVRQPVTTCKALLAIAIASLMLSSVRVQAQGVVQNTSQPLQLAQAQATQTFAIPAQALTSALDQFSEQTGIAFAYTSGELKGIQSPDVQGEFTPRQALSTLLAGTGVNAQFSGSDTVTLSRHAEQEGAMRLGPLRVGADSASNGSAAAGYVTEDVSQVGPWQGRSLQDTPFSVNVFSEDLLENLQANTPDQMFRIAPTVRLERPQAENNQPRISMRGFTVQKSFRDGVPDDQYNHMATMEDTERVEIFTGLSGFMYGPNNIGGLVNYVTKTSPEERLNQVTLSNLGNQSWYAHGDFGGKVDSKNRFGYRFNIAEQDGESSIENHEIEKSFHSLALDAQVTDGLWVMIHGADYYYKNKGNPYMFWSLDSGVQRPAAENFDFDRTYNQPWAYQWYDYKRYGSKLNWNISDSITLRAAYIESDGDRGSRTSWSNVITSAETRNQTMNNVDAPGVDDRLSAQEDNAWSVYLDVAFDTGSISHKLTAGYQLNESRQSRFDGDSAAPIEYTDLPISSPVYFPLPDAIDPVDKGDMILAFGNDYQNILLGDDITLNDQWSLLLGLAHTSIEGVPTSHAWSSDYSESAVTPSISVSYKPYRHLTTYVSYIEALEGGGSAGDEFNGSPVVNEGEVLKPLVSDQIELGAKANIKGMALTAAFFRINKSLEYYDQLQTGSYRYVQDGRQVHQGIELTAIGNITENLNIISGLTWLDAEIQEQQDPSIEGNIPQGVAEKVFKTRLEYTIPSVQGLTVSAATAYNGVSYGNNDNDDVLPAYTLFDLGARYELDVAGKPVKLQADIYNLFDEKYWGGLRGLSLGVGRSLTVSATLNF